MLVKDVMSSPALVVARSTSAKTAIRLLEEHQITSLPVTDSDGRLVGVVSEADLIRGRLMHDQRTSMLPVEERDDEVDAVPSLTQRVEEVMTRHVLSVEPEADLTDAVELMSDSAVKSLPVVAGHRVVGVVSRRDVVRVLATRDEHAAAQLDELARSAGRVWDVTVEDGVARVDGAESEADRQLARTLASTVPGVVDVAFTAVTR